MRYLLLFVFPFLCHAEATYVCVAQCGYVQAQGESTQGVQFVQLIASGIGKNTAFTNLEAKCADIRHLNPNADVPIELSGGYSLQVGMQTSTAMGLSGKPVPAKPGAACTELPSREGEAPEVMPTPQN